jgi:hypothetical protein
MAQGDSVGSFTLKEDGTIDYDPSLDGTFGGRGGTTLKLKAYDVWIDGHDLTAQGLAVGFVTTFFDSTTSHRVRLAPGPYTLYLQATGDLAGRFSVAAPGIVSYDRIGIPDAEDQGIQRIDRRYGARRPADRARIRYVFLRQQDDPRGQARTRAGICRLYASVG